MHAATICRARRRQVKPGRSVSTRKPRTRSSSSSTLAQITATSAIVPEVIHIFSPFRTYSSPTLRARVRMPPGFDPKSGSVSPKQPSFSPFAMQREPVVFLLVGAEGVDRVHDERRLHADEAAHAGVATLEFLHDEAVFHVRHAGAAVAVEVRAEEAEFAHLWHELAREAAFAVALFDDGDEVVFDELAGGIAREALVFVEEGIEADEVDSLELKGHCE